MARTPAQTNALIAKAVKSENKSQGMRDLLDAGIPVTEVAAAFGAPYGFVYGVATRNGNITATPRVAKTAKTAKPAAKATAKATTAKAAPRAKAAPAKAATKSKAKAKA